MEQSKGRLHYQYTSTLSLFLRWAREAKGWASKHLIYPEVVFLNF
jgi:hypothetical protein